MKKSELKNIIKDQVMDIYENFDGRDWHYVGVPLENKRLGIAITLGKRCIEDISVIFHCEEYNEQMQDSTFCLIAMEHDESPYQLLDDFEDYYNKHLQGVSSDKLDREASSFFNNNFEDGFYYESLDFIHPEFRNEDGWIKESHINQPDLLIDMLVDIIYEERHQIKEIIDDFKSKSILARI